MKLERRFHGGLEVRKKTDGLPVITGYAAVFYDPNHAGTEYKLYRGAVERIMPGAFDRAIVFDDVRALFNHDMNSVLGRTTSGTLRLTVDSVGLRYEIDPPDTQMARELVALIERGDISGSSFSFVADDTTYREVGDVTYLERNKVRLYDVSPVTYPAYEATSAGTRSGGGLPTHAEEEIHAWRSRKVVASRDSVTARARLLLLGGGR